MVYENGEAVPCPTESDCVGDYYCKNEGDAQPVFNRNVRAADTESKHNSLRLWRLLVHF